MVVTKPCLGPSLGNLRSMPTIHWCTGKWLTVQRHLVHCFQEMGTIAHTTVMRRGFVGNSRPEIDLEEVERRIHEYIARICLCYHDENHILIGDEQSTARSRLHMRRTSDIVNFRLDKELQYSPLSKTYLLVGRVGME